MNQFTIEFKNPKDLAKKISEYNELMNGPIAEAEPTKKAVSAATASPKEVVTLHCDVAQLGPKDATPGEPVEVKQPTAEEVPVIKPVEKTTNDAEPKEDPVVVQEPVEVKEPAQDATDDDKTAKKQALIDKAKEWLLADQANRLTPYMALMGKHKVPGNKITVDNLTKELAAELITLIG
ncbi:MAG: hypothetical protein E7G65_02585 [Veillonella sp.]|uniref:hypothetical protein n=1 Tax=Veillonella sp. TaxID=1926307 RepID=UPI00291416BC|nr:hypothetical protein [Veillonella sp.]MDU3823055.1 hypothetical protein [Veillonella sp.]